MNKQKIFGAILAGIVSVSAGAAMADGDPAKGEKQFRKCKACHQVGEGAENKVGPQLNGIVGRNVAALEDFKYSKDLAGASDKVWDEAMLDEFLTKPKDMFKGTKMAFVGIRKEGDRQDIIAYLSQFQD